MFSLKVKPPILLALAIALFVGLAACGNGQERSENDVNPPQQLQQQANDPANDAKLEQFGRLADEMYKFAAAGKLLEARSKLLDMGVQVTRIHFQGITTVDGVHALTETMTEAQRSFNAVKPNADEIMQRAAKLKLAVDALTHKNEPMWLQYDKVLREDARALDEAIRGPSANGVQAAVASLKGHYDTIRSAVLITREPQLAENMDSIIAFLENQSKADPLPVSILRQGADRLAEALNKLFGGEDKGVYLPLVDHRAPILWTFVIGSVIAAILAYAAWQMFRDGRAAVRVGRKGRG